MIGTNEGLLVSTDPTGGAGAWSASAAPPSAAGFSPEVHGLDCPSVLLCVADGPHSIITSTDPAGGASAWKAVRLPMPEPGYLTDLSCETASACVVMVDPTKLYPCCRAPHGGFVFVSNEPTGDAAAWHLVKLHDIPASLDCTTSFCIMGTDDGDVLHARRLSASARAWSGPHVLGGVGSGGNAEMDSVGCASSRYCLLPLGGLTKRGTFRSRDPLSSRASAWQYGQYLGGAAYFAPGTVSCVSGGFCAVTATLDSGEPRGYGEVVTSAGFGRRRTEEKLPGANAGVVAACVSANFCVAATADQNSHTGVLTGFVTVGHS